MLNLFGYKHPFILINNYCYLAQSVDLLKLFQSFNNK